MAAAADEDDAAVAGDVVSHRRSGAVPCFGACFGGGNVESSTTTGSRSRMMTMKKKKKKEEGNKKKMKGGRSASLSWWRVIRWSKAYPGWKSQRTVPVDATVPVVVDVDEVKTAELRRISGDEVTVVHGGGERGRKAKNRAARPLSDQPPKPADAPATSKPATCHRSVSFGPRKPAPAASPDHRKPARSVSGRRKPQPGSPASGNSGDLDPVVGMSVLIVALAVLLLWGRLCAVFCTAAWCYFLPRIRKETRPTDPKLESGSPDLDSEEYKKKVVMEGLLERSRRSATAIL